MNKIIFTFLILSFNSFASYEEHFPTYYEYCGGTRWKLKSGELGGSPGHGLNYIHGLCKDYRDSYPTVIPCSEVETSLKERYPHDGVGISLDKNFSNVSWVAVPGRELTFFGNLESRPILMSDVEDIVTKVTELKVFNDVVMKPEKFQSLEVNSSEYLKLTALETLGTDYGVNWARTLHCVRVPFPEGQLKKLADYLNQQNLKYKTGPGYEWDKIRDNCAHLAINAGHALGINNSIQTNATGIKQLFNMAVPANVFLMYSDKAVLNRPSLRKIKKSVSAHGFHRLQLGSLMLKYEAFPSGEYFETENLGVLTLPRLRSPLRLLSNPRKYEKYMTPEATELKANAQKWLEIYQGMFTKLDKEEKYSSIGEYLRQQISLSEKILSEP